MSEVIAESVEPVASEAPVEPPRDPASQIQVDEASLLPMYTNFCRVTGTPEEVILDFGLNTEPFGPSANKIKLQQRIVANFYTAKRLLMALSVAVQRHERAFGPIETDVNRRVRNA